MLPLSLAKVETHNKNLFVFGSIEEFLLGNSLILSRVPKLNNSDVTDTYGGSH